MTMKTDVDKYIAKRKRTDKAFAKGFAVGLRRTRKTMETELFNELLASVKEAKAIMRGELKPSRVFEVRPKRSATPNAVTARTLKASKAGKQIKRMANKKKLYADLGL